MPEPSTARGAATQRRILDAAADEFATRGIAGARIDRIIAAANTNKAQLYGYFGSKDGLFDAVISDRADQITDAAPFEGDLAEWAVSLYDEHLRHPEMVRLTAWLRLERRSSGFIIDNPDVGHEPKLKAIADAQAAGEIRAGDPLDLMVLVVAMASAWSPASSIYAASPEEPEPEHERRRELLRSAVRGAIRPPG